MHEGRNRQIHRMFNALGYTAEQLDRISYASIPVGGMKHGKVASSFTSRDRTSQNIMSYLIGGALRLTNRAV